MVQSEMGSGGPSGATLTIEEGIRLLNPSAVIMVGIAFGISEEKQSVGDILVSQQLIPYELQRVGTNSKNEPEIYLRDDRPSASTRMLQRFKAAAKNWQAPPEVIFGPLLSGAKLIDNQDFRDQLLRLAPEAIGGEMEGSGLYAAAQRKKVDWIVVKAICDWADGNKHQDKRQRQQRAAENAAHFTVFVLLQGGYARSEKRNAAMPQANSAGQHLSNLKSRYRTWLSKKTATFHIPGPAGVSLPIETAWAELNVLSTQDATKGSYQAQAVAEIGHRVVITGGPGAGKSTLCRKVVHDLSDLEEVVMWVSLPALARRIQNGMSINTALADAATDGSDVPFDMREILLAQATCLVADGLDECGDAVIRVAETLRSWADAHPSTRIILTSRPIGYEIKYFLEWEHYALMPLTEDQVKISSWKLIQALATDSTTVEKQIARFQEQLENNHVASLAAHIPLLLGFLIQLSLDGVDLVQQRADLYKQILDVWRLSRPQGRVWQVPPPDVLLAWRVLELAGWLLLSTETGQAACSHDRLVEQISQQLAQEMGSRPLQISTLVGNCLQFWHERGVLDRFHIGHQEVYAFVHETFNEYAAGRYLASLSLPEIQEWVRNTYRDVRWREVILLAAGCGAVETIVETLLGIYAEGELATSALYLAVVAVADAPTVPDRFAQAVADRLSALLTSANATVAYETAEQGASLVKRVPDLFAPLLRPLFEHAQVWTRFSAIYLALISKVDMIDADELDVLLEFLTTEDLLPHKRKTAYHSSGKVISSVGWDFQNKMIVRCAEMLARIRPDAKTRGQLQALYDNNHAVSSGTRSELRHVLLDLGCDEFIEERDRREEEIFKGGMFDPDILEYQTNANRKVLETILRLVSSSSFPSAKKRSKLRALTVLLYALQLPEAPIRDWWMLGRPDDIPAIEAVLSGYIEALDLNKEELTRDATWALAGLQKMDQDGTRWKSLLSLLPKFPVNPEIPKCASLDVRSEDLVRALHHPSIIIANGAAQLLAAAGKGKEAIASLLLTTEDERLLAILATIAGRLWEAGARPLLIERLDQGFTPGSWWLLEALPGLQGEHTDQRFQQMLLRALQAEEPRFAIAAVHALQQLDISLLRGMVPALQAALLYWMGQGEKAQAKSFYISDECPTCRTEPGNAYAHVNHLLHQL